MGVNVRLGGWQCHGIVFVFILLWHSLWHRQLMSSAVYACGTTIFTMTTGKAISCSLGWQYGPVFSLCFIGGNLPVKQLGSPLNEASHYTF
jgi:hypothetical protein